MNNKTDPCKRCNIDQSIPNVFCDGNCKHFNKKRPAGGVGSMIKKKNTSSKAYNLLNIYRK